MCIELIKNGFKPVILDDLSNAKQIVWNSCLAKRLNLPINDTIALGWTVSKV